MATVHLQGTGGWVADRGAGPRLIHLTTTDISLDWLLGPQLRAFQQAGFEVIGMSALGPHVERLAAMGIEHVALQHATRALAPHRDAAALVELYRHFRRLRPAIVHTHNPKPGVYGRIAARLARVPVVVNTQHGLYATPGDSFARRGLVYGLERVAAACSDAELVQNVEDRDTLVRLGVPAEKLTVLGNGIDLARFDPERLRAQRAGARAELLGVDVGAAPGDASDAAAGSAMAVEPVVVGLVGRLVVEKGYREVFAAAAHLRRSAPRVRLVIVGPDDPDKSDAISSAERAEAEALGNIRFLGLRNDIDRLYTGLDLYVLASHREGFPRSAMEAAAMGLPVVATDIRGCRQVVDAGRTGLLVPVRDPVALAEAICHLARDPVRRAAMGAAAREKARLEFDQQRVIECTLDTYRRLLANVGRVSDGSTSPGAGSSTEK